MANINLLPWRETRRQARKQRFLLGLFATLLGGVVSLFCWDLVVNGQMSHQQSRNRHLQIQIVLLDDEVAEIRDLQRKRQRLIERIRVVQALQKNRPVTVRLLEQFVRTLPDGVFYTSVEAASNAVSIEGVAASNNRVSSLMRQLGASEWLENPNLDAVESAPQYGDQATTFALTLNLKLNGAEQEITLTGAEPEVSP